MSKPTPVFNGLNLVVRDMEATLAFYRKLGVEIPDSIVWDTEDCSPIRLSHQRFAEDHDQTLRVTRT